MPTLMRDMPRKVASIFSMKENKDGYVRCNSPFKWTPEGRRGIIRYQNTCVELLNTCKLQMKNSLKIYAFDCTHWASSYIIGIYVSSVLMHHTFTKTELWLG